MRQKDSRARLTSCILRNMRAVKCHGWEEAFLERVLRIRGQELRALRTSGLLFSVSLVSFQVSTFLVMSPWSPCRVWAGGGSAGGGRWGRWSLRILEPLCRPPFLDPALTQGSLLSADGRISQIIPQSVSRKACHSPESSSLLKLPLLLLWGIGDRCRKLQRWKPKFTLLPHTHARHSACPVFFQLILLIPARLVF